MPTVAPIFRSTVSCLSEMRSIAEIPTFLFAFTSTRSACDHRLPDHVLMRAARLLL
jgi:hypothetical protein